MAEEKTLPPLSARPAMGRIISKFYLLEVDRGIRYPSYERVLRYVADVVGEKLAPPEEQLPRIVSALPELRAMPTAEFIKLFDQKLQEFKDFRVALREEMRQKQKTH